MQTTPADDPGPTARDGRVLILGTGYWVPGTGYWVLETRYEPAQQPILERFSSIILRVPKRAHPLT
jgi:hypothetical protein